MLNLLCPSEPMNDVRCIIFGGTVHLPVECSDLVILSQHPVEEFSYKPFSVRRNLYFVVCKAYFVKIMFSSMGVLLWSHRPTCCIAEIPGF